MIALKAYNREIEQLIDNGLYDEAIAHCIHILSIYPKCVEVYRNLGKSLLELKKYPDSLDVFSRVLSAIPDDFISHVGLSIIYEDLNDLDLAIWHMEQAFDVQPSNLMIQDELKRLFGKRDGEQPSKIRLTRGALVRMYARGELFQQAITEILLILDEDPRRIDLELILARMNYLSGSFDESTIICNKIIEKNPFCFEANQILQQIYSNKNELEIAAIHKNRLVSLDPYYQFIAFPFSDQEVPEEKVQLERLQYSNQNFTETQIPAWLEEIEITSDKILNVSSNAFTTNIEKEKYVDISDLKSEISIEQEKDVNLSHETASVAEEIPEWMKSAGWENEIKSELYDGELRINPQTAQPKDLSSASQSTDLPIEQKFDSGSNVTHEDLASLFSELKEGRMENDNLSSDGKEEQDFPPSEWMSQFSNSEESPSINAPSDEDFPDWLKNFQVEEPQPSQDSEEIPDWLKNLQTGSETDTRSSEDIRTEEKSEKDILEETTFNEIFNAETNQQDIDTIKSSPILEADQDGWEKVDLNSIEMDESEKIEKYNNYQSDANISDDKIPDWVKTVLLEQNSNEESSTQINHEAVQNISADALNAQVDDIDNTSQELQDNFSEQDSGLISQQTNDELLDWLRGLKTEDELPQQDAEIVDSVETTFDSQVLDDSPFNKVEPPSTGDPQSSATTDENFIDQDKLNSPEESLEPEIIPIISDENSTIIQDLLDNDSNNIFAHESRVSDISTSPEQIIGTQASEDQIKTTLPDEEYGSMPIIKELFESGNFEKLTQLASNTGNGEHDITLLISMAKNFDKENKDNFSYWQFLGDLYSKDNQLSEALKAYQKAEEILINSISS